VPSPAADRNLLFGILALQMDFVGRDALVAAMNAWVLDKAKPLGQILLAKEALRADAHALFEAQVQKHLELHGNDPERSLAARSWSIPPHLSRADLANGKPGGLAPPCLTLPGRHALTGRA
jgi:hypothetical protein